MRSIRCLLGFHKWRRAKQVVKGDGNLYTQDICTRCRATGEVHDIVEGAIPTRMQLQESNPELYKACQDIWHNHTH